MKTRAQQLGITDFPYEEFDKNGNKTYIEFSHGFWEETEYDKNGKMTYFETSNGWWVKYGFDGYGRVSHCEYYDGDWWKYKYDDKHNKNYREDSGGNKIYFIT